ncbi:glycosyltransferase [Ectothiorhodospiraceae bacterium WFHF3C12]|nr:glycosyltransferase [Ectothiorhodospiraceae bacterium WFHF3C12]
MTAMPERLPIRVAIVSDSAPERNGVGTYYRDLTEHLAPRVEAVSMICPQQGEASMKHWLGFPLPGDATQRVGVPSPLQLYRRLRSLQPHAVIIATPGPYGLLGAQFARRRAQRLIFGLHTHYEALSGLYWGTVLAGVNRWYLSTINRRLARLADHVVANAPAMCNLGRSLGARSVSMVGTLLPEAFLSQPVPRPRDRVESVLFLGRLAAEKKVHTFIDAAGRMPELRFTIAGDGPERAAVESAAATLPNLDYLGWLDRGGVLEALDACDVLALPSHVEAFGTVALEALARGKTTVVSEGCGIGEWAALSPGIHRLGQAGHVDEAVRRIAAEPPARRQANAEAARMAVHRMVREALDDWLQVLAADASLQRTTVA